jgi:hypothetical protein
MGMLEDGQGSGQRQGVDSEFRAKTAATTKTALEYWSGKGQAYSWNSLDLDIDATDTLLLVKNDSSSSLYIDYMIIEAGNAATRYQVHIPAAEVTVTGTTVTGFNLNTGSSNVATATAASDETNNTQGTIIYDVSLLATTTIIVPTPGLILSEDKSVGIDQVTESTAGNAIIYGHYEV